MTSDLEAPERSRLTQPCASRRAVRAGEGKEERRARLDDAPLVVWRR